MTETKLRPICYPCNEDKDLFDNLRELVLDGTTTLSELRRTYSEFA